MKPEVVVIDSGGANLASLLFALQRLGAHAQVSASPSHIGSASHVLLPGVGSAPDAMQRLHAAGIPSLLPTLQAPLLGICLGMQLLFAESDEAPEGHGPARCLGLLPGRVTRLQAAPDRPVPHMGWNQLRLLADDPLFEGITSNDYLYFVHSYVAPLCDSTLAVADYGQPIPAAVRRDNIRGVQFHPERSAQAGARLLANFLRIGA
ncbi:MAG: imidazole glycerol phosphate synthase subunit HisH [Nevskiaceae bacterium]|nr:imidazole glycerol phosphate synthase subunit HisH [Nevskiaceae bacterium]